MNSLKERDTYSFGALVLTLSGEGFALIGIQGYFDNWLCYSLSALAIVGVLWILAFSHGIRFGIRSVILTKLLANAITPRWLGVLYLFFFVVHIGWLTNAAMNLYTPSQVFRETFTATVICLVGMAVLILFFPDGREEKNKDAKKIIVSALSLITVPRSGNYSDLNIRPLVRILQGRQMDKCELLILRSDYNKITDAELSDNIKKVLEFIFKHNNEAETPVQNLLNGKNILQQLEILIKEVAKIEFPNQKEEIEHLTIDWTDPCDYNVFKSCHDALAKKIKEKDDRQHRLICYVSPGTALVGTIITLMAIDGNRELYYYSQERNKEDSMRLIPVNKNEIPLKNLLSQALETLALQ